MTKPIALVTGGAIGIGEATALALAKEGYRTIVTDVLEPEGRSVARKIRRNGDAEFFRMDVADSINVNEVVLGVEKKFKKSLDVIVNNAGIAKNMPIRGLKDEDWDWIHEVDLKGMMRVVRAACPKMRRAKKGNIICLSSIAGHAVGWDEHIPYSAAKAGVAGFVKATAIELARFNIRVNGIAPGLILPPQGGAPDYLEKAAKKVPTRTHGGIENLLQALDYLMENLFVNGDTLFVDGAESLR